MKKRDILYYIGTGSRWNNNELRYSLRSLERYGQGIGRIFIVGTKPDFVNDRVAFLPFTDVSRSFFNSVAKINAAIDDFIGQMTDEILIMMDDVFLCAPVNLSEYGYFFKNDHLETKRPNAWGNNINDTGELLRGLGFADRDFEQHAPFLVDLAKWQCLREVFSFSNKVRDGLAWRSIYANVHAVEAERMADCKIRARHLQDRGAAAVSEIIAGRHCFSIDDSAPAAGVADWLKAEFPTKSQWER